MRYNLQILLSFLIFHLRVFCLSPLPTTNTSFAEPRCLPDESFALLQLKTVFSIATKPVCVDNKGGVPWVPTRSWNESTNCCTWDGIKCERDTGHVISLDLRCSQLQGTLSSNSTLFFLRHLQQLDLSNNDFRNSSIAPEFGNFKNMTYLDLSMSNFCGDVPLQVSHLSKLASFGLSPSQAAIRIGAATFKALAQNLTNLSELEFYYVDMSSVQISSFMNLSSSLAFLVIYSCQLHGKLPYDVFHFPKLEVLDLSNNNLGGQIPHFSPNLALLTHVELSFNNFIGPIQEVYNNSSQIFSSNDLVVRFPSSLTYLSLSYNSINGTIPSWLFAVPSLKTLDLNYNFLTGEMEEFQTNLLERLSLARNKLRGIIPRSLFQNSGLWHMDLSENNLTSDVSLLEELSKLQKLMVLDLSYNDLSLSLNNSINCPSKILSSLILSSCNITEFPVFLMCSKSLSALDLSSNKIQGSVPKWLWEVGKDSFTYLNLSHNFLTYMEPSLSWTNLQVLDLRSNLFSGPLPISSAPHLSVLFASKNQFFGEMSISSFCNMTILQVLDLSYNNLSGKIPPCMGNVSVILSVLDLRRNRLHGNFNLTFPKESYLRSLNLNGNQLEGSLPGSLAHCQNLQVLDLGNNLFDGAFPEWLESLPNLQVLVLRSNRFQGYVENPKTKSPFHKLRIMDLSNNEFNGPLPTFFENFKAMMKPETIKMEYMGEAYYQDSIMVTIKGISLEPVKILTLLTTIDFSRNNFTGQIPHDVIGRLKSLKGLNFSHNKLKGTIPSSLGTLTNLEWLDLSANELVGKIPIELVGITLLAFLNLSSNHLEGPIPQGNQFNTFGHDSFSENLGLCGFPLSKRCDKDDDAETLPSTPEQEGDSNDTNWFEWKIMSMGYASGLVIGVSIGYMLLYSDGKLSWVGEKRRPRIIRQRK